MKYLLVGAEHPVARTLAKRMEKSGHELLRLSWEDFLSIELSQLFADKKVAKPDAIVCTPVLESPGSATATSFRLSFRQRLQYTDCFKKLGTLARKCAAPLVLLSHWRVFDGKQQAPYAETDRARAADDLAKLWFRWESICARQAKEHINLRCSWILDHRAKRWAHELLLLAQPLAEPSLWQQAQGNPSEPDDVARVIAAILAQISYGANSWGTYHYCGETQWTLQQLLDAVPMQQRARLDELNKVVVAPDGPILNYSLDCQKLRNSFGIQQRRWAGVPEAQQQTRRATGFDDREDNPEEERESRLPGLSAAAGSRLATLFKN